MARNDGISALLRAGQTWQQVADAMGCSRRTVAKVAAQVRRAQEDA